MDLFRYVIITFILFLSYTSTEAEPAKKIAIENPESNQQFVSQIDSQNISQMLHDSLWPGEAYIWYLLHSGFAIKTKSRLLIFDYIGVYRNKKDTALIQSLSTGWIDPREIKDLDVYVFVSHAHKDHYDQVVLEWQKEIKNITYIFGWQAGNDSTHLYLNGPRASTTINGMNIYTINSHHGGIPEVAYLIKVDGLTIYHSGDCRDNIVSEMAYLKSIAGSVDIAFQYDIDIDEPLNEFVIHPMLTLRPKVVFPMHWGDEEYNCQISCERWGAHGFSGICVCADKRGAAFLYRQNKVKETHR